MPTYKDWVFDGLNPSPPAPSGEVKIYTDYKTIPQDPDGTLSNCIFDGTNELIYSPDRSVISTAGWPQWVLDLEHAIDNVPLAIVGSSPPALSWMAFARRHEAKVQWIESILDGSKVKTPGNWQINLTVVQMASYALAYFEPTGLIEWFGLSLAEQALLGVGYIDYGGSLQVSTEEFSAVQSPLRGTYYSPEDFACPILDGATYRFSNSLPTDIFPISVTDITVNDLPDGYDWPWHIPQYEDGPHGMPDLSKPVYYTGEIYPTGFTRGDYLSPPYIDVRHVKRSEIDVRKSITQ
ncbi:hypothetical protein [Gimesia sp.]|uniref:hypothetical protein n=1 Tax=Gimesia sp. TaxID=2024833 RepID=UPI0032EFA6C1